MARDISYRRSLQKEILETCDRERERLGRDLHDGLCQTLAGIAALSAALARKLGDHPEAADAWEIKDLFNESITSARDMARGLNPMNLMGSKLPSALHTFATNVEALFAITCRFHSRNFQGLLPVNAELHLYRIAQEAVSNAIAHGGGKVMVSGKWGQADYFGTTVNNLILLIFSASNRIGSLVPFLIRKG